MANFIIERSSDTRNFKSIGSIAQNGIGTNSFIDVQPLSGINYYRLKIVQRDGTFLLSAMRKLDFNNKGDDILIYPNPIINGTLFLSSDVNCSACFLYDATGKLIKRFVLQGRTNTINISGITKGIYTLKVISENATHSEKIFVQ